ncbi:acyl carrier protein [Chitinivibrio alkaliphilus]|uniref:Acyl carrier protein n=1 Tax=Chitinivibrio alkaliphilus ACht1 TaxID=1313304 RepID=U7DD34_9BACT|nr:acyl carrier protein [Chitinivibrio alkaliphilus]ERP38781.1 acyl carrier protein [Chitinivibrio alkaliphilus ACht1]
MTVPNRDTVQEKVVEALCESLDVSAEDIDPHTRIREDLSADSIDMTTLLMLLEDTFDREISNEEAQTLITVEDTVSFICKKLS